MRLRGPVCRQRAPSQPRRGMLRLYGVIVRLRSPVCRQRAPRQPTRRGTLCSFLLLLRPAGTRRSGGFDVVVHLLNFGHHWILCQCSQRLLLSLRLGHPFHLMRKMVLFLALWMAARRIVQKAFGSLILLLRVILAMIQIMEVLLRPIMEIFFIICSKRLIMMA